MSIRRTKGDDASRHPLAAVLAAGAAPRRGLGTQPSAVTAVSVEVSVRNLNPPHVMQTSDGTVTISTTPGMWSGLTTKKVAKLKLNPLNMAEFNKKGYKDAVFSSPYCNHRFFVHICPPSADTNAVAYYVLARPADDPRLYTFE